MKLHADAVANMSLSAEARAAAEQRLEATAEAAARSLMAAQTAVGNPEDMSGVSMMGEWEILGTNYWQHTYGVVMVVKNIYPNQFLNGAIMGLGFAPDTQPKNGGTKPFWTKGFIGKKKPSFATEGIPCVPKPIEPKPKVHCFPERPAIFSIYIHRHYKGGCFYMHIPDMGWAGGPVTWVPAMHSYTSWIVVIDDIEVGGVSVGFCPCNGAVHSVYQYIGAPANNDDGMNLEARLQVNPTCKDASVRPGVRSISPVLAAF